MTEAEVVEETSAQSMLPAIAPARELEIGGQARGFVADLNRAHVNSPEFAAKLADIETLGARQVVASSAGPSRLLERSVAASRAGGSDATARVVGTLADLRATVRDLTPNDELAAPKRFLGLIPGSKRVRRYFDKYVSAQAHLDGIIKGLEDGKVALAKDNAALVHEQQTLWASIVDLNEYIVLAGHIDDEVVRQVSALRSSGNAQAAQTMQADLLFAVRQRRQDLMTQLTVAIQGYMSMGMVERNNKELIKGVNRAQTTTVTALRTAVITSQALDTQKLVLDQLDAVKEVTETAIAATARMMRDQTARVHEQASSPAVSVEVLTVAFDNIFATLNEIDTFKQRANESMNVSIGALTSQLARAHPQLERARVTDTAGQAKLGR
ncbi:toxic anion resistance protein [Rathayibacter rathayi]|uniref:toxic anion resistance protein n=1 Tax=Rathayibacter rathayi TaxID=33887 RepID=UPI0011B0090C|nr:toxic anion resistance protein [Rathayibacter rathayi]